MSIKQKFIKEDFEFWVGYFDWKFKKLKSIEFWRFWFLLYISAVVTTNNLYNI